MQNLDGLGFDPEMLKNIQKQLESLQDEAGVEIDDEYQKELENLLGMTYDEMNEDMMMAMKTKLIKVELMNNDAKFPEYVYPSDSGFDLCQGTTRVCTQLQR